MTPEMYEQMWSLFEEVRPLDPAARETVLRDRCASHVTLRAAVEKLLTSADAGGADLLAEPCALDVRGALDGLCEEALMIGRRVGPYEIRQPIGSGGMGQVYLAIRREDFEQR